MSRGSSSSSNSSRGSNSWGQYSSSSVAEAAILQHLGYQQKPGQQTADVQHGQYISASASPMQSIHHGTKHLTLD